MNNEFHPVEATYQTHTDSALCVHIDDKEYWFPLITITHDEPLTSCERGDDIEFEAQAWILIENDLDWIVEA